MTNNLKTKTIFLLLGLIHFALLSMAQTRYHTKDDLRIVVSGTSTMHNWDMKTSAGESNATVTLNADGKITGLTTLDFTVPAQTLKSTHAGMDKNAYKALKTTDNTTISYTMSTATVGADGAIKCRGKLSIAGTTLEEDLVATGQVNADKTISVKGSKKISMKEFNMTPPTFMLGTVKTGDDVTVQFDLTLRK